MTDFCNDYPRLEAAQQERFRAVVTRLLSGHVLTPGSALRPDVDWRFVQGHSELIDGYLRIGGWRLDLDLSLRLCRAVHEQGEQRVRFTKQQSLVLCLLRLAYHEEMQRMSEDGRCELRVGEIRERVEQLGKGAPAFTRRSLTDALRRLSRHSLVTIDRGFSGEDEERVLVNPLVEKVLPTDTIASVSARLKAYAATATADAAEPDGDAPDDEPDTGPMSIEDRS